MDNRSVCVNISQEEKDAALAVSGGVRRKLLAVHNRLEFLSLFQGSFEERNL
jgi:hypothetical protein